MMSLIKFLMEIKKVPSWEREPAISDQELDELIDQTKKKILRRPLLQFGGRKEKICHGGKNNFGAASCRRYWF